MSLMSANRAAVMTITTFVVAASAFTVSSVATAEQLLVSYDAHLSTRDHFSSKGVPLYNVAAILRQDRANYHKFGKRDAGDDWDRFFASKSNRAKMERLVRRGAIPRYLRNRIINNTPHVTVKIYSRSRSRTRIQVIVH